MKMIDSGIIYTKKNLAVFCDKLKDLSKTIGFRVSSRGWAYIMEQHGLITKNQFDKVEGMINRGRKYGLLPVDFVAEESSRSFHGICVPSDETFEEHVGGWLRAAYNCHESFEPDWWNGEEYYVQMLVEKVDLISVFQPVCVDYHIPIGNARGWSSILQRADYARRFADAEERGLKCVLLYCGDTILTVYESPTLSEKILRTYRILNGMME